MVPEVHNISIDLIGDLDVNDLRIQAERFEAELKEVYRGNQVCDVRTFTPSLFNSPESIAWTFGLKNAGLTYKSIADLRPEMLAALRSSIEVTDYFHIQNLCNGFNETVLMPVLGAGKLKSAQVVEDINDAPAYFDFKADFGFYLRPSNTLGFLSANNGAGGPRELIFRYVMEEDHGHFYQDVAATYDPAARELSLKDWGLLANGQVPISREMACLETTPLENLVKHFSS
jgi:hypothetical protein